MGDSIGKYFKGYEGGCRITAKSGLNGIIKRVSY